LGTLDSPNDSLNLPFWQTNFRFRFPSGETLLEQKLKHSAPMEGVRRRMPIAGSRAQIDIKITREKFSGLFRLGEEGRCCQPGGRAGPARRRGDGHDGRKSILPKKLGGKKNLGGGSRKGWILQKIFRLACRSVSRRPRTAAGMWKGRGKKREQTWERPTRYLQKRLGVRRLGKKKTRPARLKGGNDNGITSDM